jgi:hypothetical protein
MHLLRRNGARQDAVAYFNKRFDFPRFLAREVVQETAKLSDRL